MYVHMYHSYSVFDIFSCITPNVPSLTVFIEILSVIWNIRTVQVMYIVWTGYEYGLCFMIVVIVFLCR